MNVYYQPRLSKQEWESGELSSFEVYRYFENARLDYPDHEIVAYCGDDIENPTYADDNDHRSQTFYVDIPVVVDSDDTDETWTNVAEFKTYEEAVELVQKRYGADKFGRVGLVTPYKF